MKRMLLVTLLVITSHSAGAEECQRQDATFRSCQARRAPGYCGDHRRALHDCCAPKIDAMASVCLTSLTAKADRKAAKCLQIPLTCGGIGDGGGGVTNSAYSPAFDIEPPKDLHACAREKDAARKACCEKNPDAHPCTGHM